MGTGNPNEDKVYQEAVSWNPFNLKRRIHEVHDALLNEQRENTRLRAELERERNSRYRMGIRLITVCLGCGMPIETDCGCPAGTAKRLVNRRAEVAEARVRELKEALSDLLDRDMQNTCMHEETYRGGVIWEICNNCGMKWAYDKGGKPEWVDPPEWTKAENALANSKKEGK